MHEVYYRNIMIVFYKFMPILTFSYYFGKSEKIRLLKNNKI